MAERHAAIVGHALDAELGWLVIRRYDDSKPNVELAGIEKAHAESAIRGRGRLHTFVHQPEAAVAIEGIVEPHTRDTVPRSATEQGEECLPHTLGHFEVGGIELPPLVGEKHIECPPSALVRLEERDVAEHLRC